MPTMPTGVLRPAGAAPVTRLRPQAPAISAWGGLLAIYFACMLVISTGNAEIYHVPRLLIAAGIFMIWATVKLKFNISKKAAIFAASYLFVQIPGSVVAIFEGRLDWQSAGNLVFSLLLFVIFYSFVYAWISTNSREKLLLAIDRLLIALLLFSIFELLFYRQIYFFRDQFYNLSKFFPYEVGMGRELSEYGIPRPTAFFSEPANFARSLCTLLTARVALSGYSVKAIVILIVSLVVTRSAQLLFAAPALFLIYLWAPLMMQRGKRQIEMARLPAAIFAALVLLAGTVYLQGNRVDSAIQGTDSSLTGRLLGPVAYVRNQWQHPLIGSGATPQNEVGEYSFLQGRADRAKLLDSGGYKEANAPSVIFIVACGLFGLICFFALSYFFMGIEGLVQVGVFFASNLFSGGYNSPIMFLPLAIVMALTSYAWHKRRIGIQRSATSPSRARAMAIGKQPFSQS